MSTTSSIYDWGTNLAMDVAEQRAGSSGQSSDSSFDLGGGGGFNFSGESGGGGGGDFPDWLQEPNMDELEKEYQDARFNINPFVKPIKRFAEAQYSNALQQGAGAADEAIARAFQSGIVGPINTSMISAQTAMPALLAKLGAKSDIAGLRIQNMYKQQEARSALAAQIAGMRKSYVDTMAQFALGQGKLNLEAQLGRGSLDLQRDQFNFNRDRYEESSSGGGGTSWEDLSNVMSSWNSALGSGGAAINWQRFLSGLSSQTKGSPADMSLLGLA